MADHQPPGAPIAAAQEPVLPESLFDGRYHIVRVLGTGGFGRVFLAVDTRLGRDVAIKELLADRQRDRATYDRYLERFQREARAGSSLRSQNVVTVYDLHVDAEGNYYLVLEYVEGQDLSDLLAQVGVLPIERALAVTLDIAQALDQVHEQDVVHRDIKPANILITVRGLAKLSDFGLAQVAHESQRSQIASRHPGTPVYMSPEQRVGYGYIDGRSDLYSLGLVLYEMLTGRRFGETNEPLIRARPDLPPAVVAVVDKLLQEDRDDRYQSARALIRDLTKVATRPDMPIAALPSAQATPKPATAAPSAPPAGASRPAIAPPLPPGHPIAGPPPAARARGRVALVIVGAVLVLMLAAVVIVLAGRAKQQSPPAPADAPVGTAPLVAATPPAPTPIPTATSPPELGAAIPTAAVIAPSVTRTAPGGATAATSGAGAALRASPTPTAANAVATDRAGSDPRASAASTTTHDPAGHVPPSDSPAPNQAADIPAGEDTGASISLGLPRGWQFLKDSVTSQQFVRSPDGTLFFPRVRTPATGTVGDEIAQQQRELERGLSAHFTNAEPLNLRIGGEAALALSFTYVPKNQPGAGEQTGEVWVVNHNGREYIFIALAIGVNQRDTDGIIATVAFA